MVVASTVGCSRNSTAPNVAGYDVFRAPLGPNVAAMKALSASAPVLKAKAFGKNVDVTIFNPPSSWAFSRAQVVGDDLYVTYLARTTVGAGIGILRRGVLRSISLPRDYASVEFENGDGLVSAMRASEPKADWFALRGARAIPVARPASVNPSTGAHVLADGGTCASGSIGSGSAIDEVIRGRRFRLLSSTKLRRATSGAIARIGEPLCDHFDGVDYVTVGTPPVILRLRLGRASVFASGFISTSSDKHLLIWSRGRLIEADAR